MLAQLLGG